MGALDLPDETRVAQARAALDAHRAKWRPVRDRIAALQAEIDQRNAEIEALHDDDAFIEDLPRMINAMIVVKAAEFGDMEFARNMVRFKLAAAGVFY